MKKKSVLILLIFVVAFMTFGVAAESVEGCAVFGPKTQSFIKWGLNLLRIGAPVLVVLLGVTDFLKILMSGEEKTYKEAGMRFVKRLLALVVLEFIPYVLLFLLDISGVLKQYGIGSGDIYCVIDF